MLEQWKEISGYSGIYEISDQGNVRSMDRMTWNGKAYHKTKGKPVRQFLSCERVKYYYVALCKDSKYKQISVHRLVALNFIPNPENKKYVGHKDSNSLNNHVDNLEWCTAKENEAIKRKNHPQKGEQCPTAKLKIEQVNEIKRMYRDGKRIFQIAKETGVNKNTVKNITSKANWND